MTDRAEATDWSSMPASTALEGLLAEQPEALVVALDGSSGLVPVPASVPLKGHRTLLRSAALDLFVAEDIPMVIQACAGVSGGQVLRVEARLQLAPMETVVMHVMDVRAEHGVEIVVLDISGDRLDLLEATSPNGPSVGRVVRSSMSEFLEVDAAASRILGWSAQHLIGTPTLDYIHPDDMLRAVRSWVSLRAGLPGDAVKIRFRRGDGRYVWIESRSDPVPDTAAASFVTYMVDISEEMSRLEELHDQERHLRALAEALPIGIGHVRADRQLAFANEPLSALFGDLPDVEALIQRVDADDRPQLTAAVEQAFRGRSRTLEIGTGRGAEARRCEITVRAMATEDGFDGVIVCASDVTEASRLRAGLQHRADHDALTGCLNRAATVVALKRALAASERVAVAFVDLDGLKAINDELGHSAGDEVLCVAADRLRGATRVRDHVGRLGGDEFVVIAPDGRTTIDPQELTDRLSAAVCGVTDVGGAQVAIRASIGVAVSEPGEDVEALIDRADAAMYAVKRSEPSRRSLTSSA